MCVRTASTKIIRNYAMLNSDRVLIACFLVFIKRGTFIVQPEWPHIWSDRSYDLHPRKVKLMLSVTALCSWRLSFPSLHSSSSANSWDDNLSCCAYEQGSFVSMAMSFHWLGLFCWIQRTAFLGFLSLSVSLHICSYLISWLLLSGMLRDTLFSQVSLSFLFMKKFHELISLNLPNYFPFLWLGPPSVSVVLFFKIKVHYCWLPQLEGVGRRQPGTNSFSK